MVELEKIYNPASSHPFAGPAAADQPKLAEMKAAIVSGQANLFGLSEVAAYRPFAAAYREELVSINEGFALLEQGAATANILSALGVERMLGGQLPPQALEKMRAELSALPNERERELLRARFDLLCAASAAERHGRYLSFRALSDPILQNARTQIDNGKMRLCEVIRPRSEDLDTRLLAELKDCRADLNQVPQDGANIRAAFAAIQSGTNELTLSTLFSKSSTLGWGLRTAATLAIPVASYCAGYTDYLSTAVNVGAQAYLWRNEAWSALGYAVNMNGPHNRIQDFALGIIRRESRAALEFIRKPHNYVHGIFNHLLFLPFVEPSTR